ncbi:MAG: DUF305 domain-containing protein [Treponemataceae bacterium]
MKKFMFVLVAIGMVFFTAGNAFAQAAHTMEMTELNPSQKIIASMHAPMMLQPMVIGKQPEIAFLENMIPHHQGAIDSSKLLLTMSDNEMVKEIAQRIIGAQEAEIAEFKSLIEKMQSEEKKLPSKKNLKKFDTDAKKIMDGMMATMSKVALSDDIAMDFLAGMIPHHQGAVDAAKQIAKVSTDDRIKKIANRIIADQEKEIVEFKALMEKK